MQRHPADVARDWFVQAERDLQSAAWLAKGERFEAACFYAQQAAEKALKGLLIWLGGDRPLTHVIGQLLETLAAHDAELAATLRETAELDAFYVPTRYPDAVGGIPGTKYYGGQATLALAHAARVLESVAPRMPPAS